VIKILPSPSSREIQVPAMKHCELMILSV